MWVWTFLIPSSWAADRSLFVWAPLHYLLTCQGRAAYSVKSFMKADIQLEKKTGDRKSTEPEVFTSLYHSLHLLSLFVFLCSSASGVIQELLINNSLITRSTWTINVQLWMHDSVLKLFINCHMMNWTGQATVIHVQMQVKVHHLHTKPRCESQPDATPELRGGVCDGSLVHQACWCELYSPADYVMLDLFTFGFS